MEEPILFPERLVARAGMRVLGLGGHVGICHLRDVGEEEDAGQKEDKNANGEVDPLHALERVDAVSSILEEDIRAQHGANNSADSLDSLGKVDTQLRVLGRSANCHKRVGCGLERTQSGADDDRCTAEAAEGAVEASGPHAEGTDAVEDQTEHECGLVAIVAEGPVGESEGGEGVSTVEEAVRFHLSFYRTGGGDVPKVGAL